MKVNEIFKNPFKKKDNDEDRKKQIASPTIHIVIHRLMSDVTPVIVAEFDAMQQKDASFNMQLINEDAGFFEDLDFTKERIIDYLNYKLDLKQKTKQDALNLIQDKINVLDKELKQVKDGKLNGDKVNTVDLEDRLTHYKVLKYHVENKGDGSYEIINAKGQREIHFATVDGVLYPYFWRSNVDNGTKLTLFPDITSKRKIYKDASERAIEDYIKSQEGFFTGIKGILATIAIVVLIVGGIIFNARVMSRNNEIDDIIESQVSKYRKMANDNAVQCGYYYTKLIEDEVINRSINLTYADAGQPNKKETSVMVDISNKLTGTT